MMIFFTPNKTVPRYGRSSEISVAFILGCGIADLRSSTRVLLVILRLKPTYKWNQIHFTDWFHFGGLTVPNLSRHMFKVYF